jgi:hypothetical protein
MYNQNKNRIHLPEIIIQLSIIVSQLSILLFNNFPNLLYGSIFDYFNITAFGNYKSLKLFCLEVIASVVIIALTISKKTGLKSLAYNLVFLQSVYLALTFFSALLARDSSDAYVIFAFVIYVLSILMILIKVCLKKKSFISH